MRSLPAPCLSGHTAQLPGVGMGNSASQTAWDALYHVERLAGSDPVPFGDGLWEEVTALSLPLLRYSQRDIEDAIHPHCCDLGVYLCVGGRRPGKTSCVGDRHPRHRATGRAARARWGERERAREERCRACLCCAIGVQSVTLCDCTTRLSVCPVLMLASILSPPNPCPAPVRNTGRTHNLQRLVALVCRQLSRRGVAGEGSIPLSNLLCLVRVFLHDISEQLTGAALHALLALPPSAPAEPSSRHSVDSAPPDLADIGGTSLVDLLADGCLGALAEAAPAHT